MGVIALVRTENEKNDSNSSGTFWIYVEMGAVAAISVNSEKAFVEIRLLLDVLALIATSLRIP